MSKNLIPEICKMLGVELLEEFKVEGDNRTYWFDLDGLRSGKYVTDYEDDAMLHDLLCGEVEIIKLPWKPKQDETFYTFGIHATENKWVVVSAEWWDNVKNLALYKIGWIYRTQAEAEAALPAVAAEIGVEYEL